ncbi:MAG: hypothetical protein AAF195_03350 [Pseudomonadota bacterium]
MKEKIYIENIIGILKEIADWSYQERAWDNPGAKPGDMTISFDEAVNMLFDDCIVGDLLEDGEIIISKKVTKILQELSNIIDNIDENRSQEEIIYDPKMDIVRQKATKALDLIKENDGSESTVRFVKVGTSDIPITIEDAF